ncbi:MAG: ABC-type multidrug transport system fused ATPase/permease subunit [Maribacter sp.]|jgi:ABC-type multidrug transport system fused ATPase/permease subunit
MKSLKGLLKYIENYKKHVALNVISNLLMVVFSVVSIPSLIPFLRLLFDRDVEAVSLPDWSASGLDKYVQYMNYEFYELIEAVGKQTALLYVCAFILSIFFFKNLFRFLSLYFMAPVRTGIIRDIRNQLYDKFNELPLSYYSQKKKGDLISRMTSDVLEVESSILNVLETIVREPLMIIGCLTYMLYVSPSLTFFVILMVLVMGGVIGVIGSKLRKGSAKAQGILGEMVSILEETLTGMRIIKGFNAQGYRKAEFSKTNNSYRDTLIPVFRRRDLSSPLSEFLGIGVVAILLIIGSRYVFSGEMTPETFLPFLFAFYSVINPAKAFSKAYYNVQKGLAASDRIKSILKEENPIRNSESPFLIDTLKHEISFRNVSHSYEEGIPVLKNINLDIPEGKIVALVGPSGGGKTTLTDLLPRFYDINEGKILIDHQNIQSYDIASLRGLFGIVSQQPILFHDSIYNNIVFGRKGITKEQVETAARIANAHEFILETEYGYDSIIGDGGDKLSGGQKQRLTIARAILDNPPVLILDEATSSLDSASEKAVQEALKQVMKNRTVIVIAHRLSTISNADIIVVMKEGEIVEKGTHQELIAQKGVYTRLVKMQAI